MAWLGALLFTLLFFHQRPGINLLLFESVMLWWLFRMKGDHPFSITSKIVLCCQVLTLFGVFLSNNLMALIINVALTALLPAVMMYPDSRSPSSLFVISLNSFLHAPAKFMREKSSKFSLFYWLWQYRFLLIPLVVIFIFIGIYANANDVFGEVIERTADKFLSAFDFLFERVDSTIIMLAAFGLITSVFLLFHTLQAYWVEKDRKSSDTLFRLRIKRKSPFFAMNGLQREFRAAMFLLISLNLLIGFLNVIDISQVWFGYSWRGENFASMVHEGTALLIFSVLISMAIVLFYFRRNLNFYPKNKALKVLALVWIIQNGILLISVFIRTFHYCKVFSIAERRIGLFVFLTIVAFGLFTIFRKVKWNFTSFYLFRMNSLSLVIILSLTSVVPWDIVIARYNFSKGGEAFVYLEHMASLSDKALPYLIKDIHEVEHITQMQYDEFSFRERNMTAEEYVQEIEIRKQDFIHRWENQGWLSWNLPEYLAYQRLK